MLKQFKAQADKWFIKLLLGLIALSFGVWGIGDSIYQYISNRPLGKVKDKPITVEEFLKKFDHKISQMQEQLGRSITPQERYNLKLHDAVLKEIGQLLSYELLIEDLKLLVDPKYVKEQIQKIDVFQKDGTFSQKMFEDLLSSNRISPTSFIQKTSENVITQQFGILQKNLNLSQPYRLFLTRALKRQRQFRVAIINFEAIKAPSNVNSKALEGFFEEKKGEYTVPSTRDIEVLIIDQENVLKKISLPVEVVKKAYNERLSEFKIPEKRRIAMVTCPDMKDAHKILKLIQNGKSMKMAAKSSKNATYQEKGWITKDQLPSTIAETVFKLDATKKTTSDIVQQEDHFVIYKILDTKKEMLKSFESVRLLLEKQLKQDELAKQFENLKAVLDDELASGKPLKDIEKNHGLRYIRLDAVAMDGNNVRGENLLESYDEKIKKVILEQGFSLDAGTDSSFQDVGSLGSVLVQVSKIYPPSTPSFSDVKEKVRKDYNLYKQEEEARAIAQELLNAKTKSFFEEKAKKNSIVVMKDLILSRSDFYDKKKNFIQAQEDGLSQAFVKPLEVPTLVYTKEGIAVMMAVSNKPYELTFESSQKLLDILNKGLLDDMEYVILQWCEKNYPIDLNEGVWSKIKQYQQA